MKHASHPKIILRLKRAEGHLRRVIAMLEVHSPCLDVAQQLQAVEAAVSQAKKTLIHDHMDHCLTDDGATADRLVELKQIAKFL